MNQWTSLHMAVLRRVEVGLLVTPTTIVQELTAAGLIVRNRYVYTKDEAGWLYTLTPRGMAVLYPMPPVRGSAKRLTEAQSWMD